MKVARPLVLQVLAFLYAKQAFAGGHWENATYHCGPSNEEASCNSMVDGGFDPTAPIGHGPPWFSFGLDGVSGRISIERSGGFDSARLDSLRAGGHQITQRAYFRPNTPIRFTAFVEASSPSVVMHLFARSSDGTTAVEQSAPFTNLWSDYYKTVQLGFTTPNVPEPSVEVTISFYTDDAPAWIRVGRTKLETFVPN